MKRSHSFAGALALSACLVGGSACLAATPHAQGGASTQNHVSSAKMHSSNSHAQAVRTTSHVTVRSSTHVQTFRGAGQTTSVRQAHLTTVKHTIVKHAVVNHSVVNHPVARHPMMLRSATKTRIERSVNVRTTHTRTLTANRVVSGHHTIIVNRTITVLPRHVVARHFETFERGERVFGRVTSVSGSRVTVRLPNGSERVFFSRVRPTVGNNVVAFTRGSNAMRFEPEDRFFQTGEIDRDRVVFRSANSAPETFRIVRVSRPFGHRVVFFANEDNFEGEPEVVFLRSAAFNQDVVTFVEPNGVLVPMAITQIQPLPGGQIAFLANDQVSPTFVPAQASFVGQVVSIVGNLVTFLLPDGSTRTLYDNGPFPNLGSQVVVYEDGSQVLGFQPAVTNFVGQVVGVDNGFTTFMLPDGSLRTLVVQEPPALIGSRVVVYENGPRVERIVQLY
jgi:hypothetical protein